LIPGPRSPAHAEVDSDCLRNVLHDEPLNFTTLSLYFYPTITQIYTPSDPINNDCVEVDERILEIADYKNDYADVAAEKLIGGARLVGNEIEVNGEIVIPKYPLIPLEGAGE